MNKHRLITMGILALVTAVAAFLLFSHNSARTALEETRRALRQQGFKIYLAEFDFSTLPELRARATALTNADLTGSAFPKANPARRLVLPQERLNFVPTVGSNAALVVWKQEKLPTYSGQDPWLEQTQSGKELWVTQREIFNEERASLDAACEAAMSGPIRFDLVASQGLAIVLRHLLLLKNLTQILDTRAVLELHDGNKDAAWTNLLASTRLVSAWNPEPVEVSHLVRFECATLAYNATWQALQADGWADDRLALLQQEWESVDFFHGLPETEAFTRAGAAALCELERQEPLPQRILVGGILRSPRNTWYRLVEHWRRIRYRHHGSYEDESALLLHYRDRELQVRRAVQSSNWSEMRPLPVVTNMMPFYSKDSFRMQTELNRRQMMLGIHIFNTGGGGQDLLGRAAEAEARRRLLMVAIALEQYRIRHSGYPKTLQELVPELLQSPPVDFMDGKPLRYRLGEDGRFVLYSVGLDCVDDGGKLPRRERRDAYNPYGLDASRATDLVWPHPASAAEIQAQQAEDERQAELERATMQERKAEADRQTEDERQAAIEKLLTEAEARKAARASGHSTVEPAYRGRPLTTLLRNDKTAGTNYLTLDELLTARQITAGDYDGTPVFEVPVSYDTVTNLGALYLVVDDHLDAAFQHGEVAERQTCERATNGNCLLGWTTTYDPPRIHAIQTEFIATKDGTALKFRGPAVAFVLTNLCQFDAAYDHFDAREATLYARLPESNGVYTIKLKAPAGAHIKTLTGTTSNGVIKVHWDLLDDHGSRWTNEAFDSVFQVTLLGSGRSQTLKGP